jgi:centromeric protein E
MNVVSPASVSLSSGEAEFKPLQNIAEEIKVVIRIRPLNERETNPAMIKPSMGVRCWKILNEHNAITQTLNDGITPVQDKVTGRVIFSFDKVFDERSETKDIYEFSAKEIVANAVKGRNGSIFAYGQTSSGKTYTMQGSRSISHGKGVGKEGFVHLAAADLFHEISTIHDRDFKIFASVIEVYNDDVRDMLVDNTSTKKSNVLKIREDPQNGLFVQNAIKVECNSLAKLFTILSSGEKNRIVAKTTLNKRSSRSHLIFSIMLVSKPTTSNKSKEPKNRRKVIDMEMSQVSTLNLIDLAGSESVRYRSAHSNEKRRIEGGSINKRYEIYMR